MLVTRYLAARSWASSTFSLPTLTLPANWVATRSMIGVSWRQGPHQGAQKSTRTGISLLATSCSQLSAVNSMTFWLAIGGPFNAGGYMWNYTDEGKPGPAART